MTLGNRQLSMLAVEACIDSYVEYGVLSAGSEIMARSFSIRDGNAAANIYQGRDFNVICFRGTDDAMDWMGNMRLTLAEPRYIKPYRRMLPFVPNARPLVHRGFYHEYQRLHEEVLAAVARIDGEQDHWLVTGHSLGGAMANVAVLRESFGASIDLVTFGSPRWGNKDACWLASQYTSRMLRFRNGVDIVPLLPAPLGRWKHACPEICLNGSNSNRPVGAHNIYDYRVGLQRYNG